MWRQPCGCDKLFFSGRDIDRFIQRYRPFTIRFRPQFSMKLEEDKGAKAIAAMKEASRIAEENGIADMSLKEINAEIAAVRAQPGQVRPMHYKAEGQ